MQGEEPSCVYVWSGVHVFLWERARTRAHSSKHVDLFVSLMSRIQSSRLGSHPHFISSESSHEYKCGVNSPQACSHYQRMSTAISWISIYIVSGCFQILPLARFNHGVHESKFKWIKWRLLSQIKVLQSTQSGWHRINHEDLASTWQRICFAACSHHFNTTQRKATNSDFTYHVGSPHHITTNADSALLCLSGHFN